MVVILDAVRTPRGKAKATGGLAVLKPQQLVGALASAMAERRGARLAPDALILGCVGQVGAQGGHLALATKLSCGMPDAAAAWTINNYCASGLTAIGQASGFILAGGAQEVLAGGVEMLSRVPFMADGAAFYRDSDLPQRARYIPVALAADRLAEAEGISRAEMDASALDSQRKTYAAERTPLIASRVAVNGLDKEECAREWSAETLARLTPAFGGLAAEYAEALDHRSIDHRHTLAHAPPMADGAGLALIAASAREGTARAEIVAYAEVGGDPLASLTAGFSAMDRALAQAGLQLGDMDRIEFMEAFAVAIVKFMRDRSPDPHIVNVGGGHLAKGHPMGATGALLVSALLDGLDACDGELGLVVATGAQGVGSAMIVKRLKR